MSQKQSRDCDKTKTEKQSKPTSGQLVPPPEPPFIEGAEAKVIYYKPQEDEAVPKSRFGRILYFNSQIILGALTLGILIFYLIQWLEFRNSRVIENRAYVVAKTVAVVPSVDDPTQSVVSLICVNAGKTPGLKGDVLTIIERREASPPDSTVINPAEKPTGRIIFGPGIDMSSVVSGMKRVLPRGLESATATPTPTVPAGKKPPSTPQPTPIPSPTPAPEQADQRLWFVYGIVSYEDIFGNARQTRFCFENIVGTQGWYFCPTFNDAN